jgi:hypothetical protein
VVSRSRAASTIKTMRIGPAGLRSMLAPVRFDRWCARDSRYTPDHSVGDADVSPHPYQDSETHYHPPYTCSAGVLGCCIRCPWLVG